MLEDFRASGSTSVAIFQPSKGSVKNIVPSLSMSSVETIRISRSSWLATGLSRRFIWHPEQSYKRGCS
jgi:hypothetical protein